jgi:hypothetical protein
MISGPLNFSRGKWIAAVKPHLNITGDIIG